MNHRDSSTLPEASQGARAVTKYKKTQKQGSRALVVFGVTARLQETKSFVHICERCEKEQSGPEGFRFIDRPARDVDPANEPLTRMICGECYAKLVCFWGAVA